MEALQPYQRSRPLTPESLFLTGVTELGPHGKRGESPHLHHGHHGAHAGLLEIKQEHSEKPQAITC